MDEGVGVYRQAFSGIPLAVGFVGRDRLLWNSMVQGTQRFRQVQAASLRITLRPVWFVLPKVLMIIWRGSLPALIYPGGQGYMESPSQVQLESYNNTFE